MLGGILSVKIKVRELTKIFGNNPKKGIKLLKEGKSKKRNFRSNWTYSWC